jgi:hypothetical protein
MTRTARPGLGSTLWRSAVTGRDARLGQCSGMAPRVYPQPMHDVPMRDLPARKVWWAFVVAGVRSKVGATLLVLSLGLSAWLFATGHATLGLVELAILTLFYARIPVAIGMVLGRRAEPQQR